MNDLNNDQQFIAHRAFISIEKNFHPQILKPRRGFIWLLSDVEIWLLSAVEILINHLHFSFVNLLRRFWFNFIYFSIDMNALTGKNTRLKIKHIEICYIRGSF